jgi:cellulose synthase/poly-beta-1,6-N-acetylglucosamine synthase-like glycosyltransferase
MASMGGASAAARRRIGEILRDDGAAAAPAIEAALAAQAATGARLGDILVARGWTTAEAVGRAAARQHGLPFADLSATPLDPALLDPRDLGLCLRRRLAPWRRDDGGVVWACADPDDARDALARLADPPAEARLALAEPAALAAAMTAAWGPALAARAAARPPVARSARAPMPDAQRAGLTAAALAVALGLLAAPGLFAPLLLAGLICLNAANAAVRIAALGSALRRGPDPAMEPAAAAPGVEPLAARRPAPKISLIVALRDEPATMPLLLHALERLDWPRERLDAMLVIEADDAATRDAVEALRPPPWVRVLTAPPGEPRTKPRALNYALDFAEGDIVGVYDAEDRPEPDQLKRVAAILRDGPPEVACVQCRLAYYNAGENWLTRCFGIEYAMWFDVLLAAFRDLGFPVPLGGTSVFFRRRALERVGAWDAHNVTEDADLGMRLAREGFRTEICGSTTHEEANSRLGPWVRQRSRWLKGYMTTWLVHMRDPRALWAELGPAGFVGFQAIFVGAAVAYLGLPLFWTAWALALAGHGPAWLDVTPFWLLAAVAVVQLSGWLAMLCAALLATARRRLWGLQPFIPTLVFYWPIGAVAAWLALAELFVAPFHWRKTPHGMGRIAAAEREAAIAARGRRDAA